MVIRRVVRFTNLALINKQSIRGKNDEVNLMKSVAYFERTSVNYAQFKIILEHLIKTGFLIPNKSWEETDWEIQQFLQPKR